MDLLEKRVGHGRQRLGGAEIEDGRQDEVLTEGDVKEGPGVLAHTFYFGIGGDGDDASPAGFDFDAAADGVLAAPETLRHGAIHDGDERGVLVVVAGEFAAGGEGD